MSGNQTRLKQPHEHYSAFCGAVLKRIKAHQTALRAIKRALPAFLKDHCLDCVISDRGVILFTESAAFATQLRFYAPTLLRALTGSQPVGIEHIRIRILPPLDREVASPRQARLPSPEVVDHLKANARHAPDGRLSRALSRLSQTLERRRRDESLP